MKLIESISLVVIYLIIITVSIYIQFQSRNGNQTSNVSDEDIPSIEDIPQLEEQAVVKDKTTDISHAKRIILNKEFIKPEVIKKININQL